MDGLTASLQNLNIPSSTTVTPIKPAGKTVTSAKTGKATIVTGTTNTPRVLTDSEKQRAAGPVLWTTKYAPEHANGIIGNLGVVGNIVSWLKDWENVVIKGNKKETKFKPGGINNIRMTFLTRKYNRLEYCS